MKKLLLPALVLGLTLASCDIVELKDNSSSGADATEWGKVSFALGGGALPLGTRSTAQAAESTVNSLQVLIYNSSNNLVAYASSRSGSLDANVPLKIGGHVVYAAVNVAEDLSVCSTPTSLTTKVSYLRDNSASGLQMFGSLSDQTFTSNSTVTVEVRRFASKVEIDEIVPDFKAASFRQQEFQVKGIYLINVNGTCPFSQDPATGSTWYNPMQYVSGECNALISDKFSSPVTIQTSAGIVTPYTTKHYFYCYPNPTQTDTHGGSTFSPRRTRLVVETSLGGRTSYYPLDIFGAANILNLNTAFTLTRLTITGPGADNPDDLLENGTVSFSVSIKDWENGFTKTVTY